jgi:enamine deaminase RidA (YjgF/YER057c/UK114 family)
MKYGPDETAMTASPAVWAGNTLYMSGLCGFSPLEGVAAGNLEKQVRQMARNHMDILDAAGLKLEDVVSGCVYLRDINDYQAMNAIYREYFALGPGARTCLMPNCGYEKNDVRVRASFVAARTRKQSTR